MNNVVLDILDFQIAGYRFRDFQWYWDLLIVAIALVVFGIGYLLYVWVFTKCKMSKKQEDKFNETYKANKKANKEEKKAYKSSLKGAEKRLYIWKKIKAPIISTCSVILVIGLVCAPVLPVVWDQLMGTFFVNRGVGGDNNSESAQLAIGAAKQNVETLESEGIVLLKNEDEVLPLNKENNNKVNIFGSSAFGMLYGGGGSGVFLTNAEYNGNDFHAVRFEQAMTEQGFEYNMNLYNVVANYYDTKTYSIAESDYDINNSNNVYPSNTIINGVQLGAPTCFPYDNEPDTDAYTRTYSGLDGKTLLEDAQDYSDTAIYCVSRAGSEDGDMERSILQLTTEEENMINMLKDNFDKVVFLINSSNCMELGPVNQEGIDAVMWIGHPGLTGNRAVAKAIDGEINPSGRLVDTWAYDISDNPSFQSFGPDTTLSYSNANYRFVECLEGIYVGYRYFVTRALTDSTFIYEDHVQYSFGEGYSYTTFEQYISDWEVDYEEELLKIDVNVTNTGSVAGKDVIQLYHSSPYNGVIEVPSHELCAFNKTNLLDPGESQTISFEISFREIALWSSDDAFYKLLNGDHEITLRKNAWEIMPLVSGKDNTVPFTIDEDINYEKSYQTGEEYTACFEDAEYGPNDTELTYLSRSDWEGTYPNYYEIDTDASAYTISASQNASYADYQITDEAVPTMGAKNGLVLANLRGKDYDDPLWESLLDQLTFDEMKSLVDNGDFRTVAVASIGKRATYDDDGPASIQVKSTGYVSEVVIASSWNVNCGELLGQSAAREGASMGLTGWYAPGMNIHRCPTGGRNFEYYSEDPLITGKMGGAEAKGTARYGVYTYAKHFALNEQETSRFGLEVWSNEQAIRQIYLRGFEIYCDEGGLGLMSSFSRVGNRWSGGHEGLCNQVLRNEWGFHGVVVTDWLRSDLMPVNMGLRGGNDLWLYKNTVSGSQHAYDETPHDTLILLRRACHHILYACAQSNCVWDEEDYEDVGILDINWDLAGVYSF